VLDVVLWIVVVAGGLVGSTQFSNHPRLAPVQALTPWLLAPSFPVMVLAAATSRWWLGAAAAGVTATMVALGPPLRRRRISSAEVHLRVLYANVKFDQPTPDQAAQALIRHVVDHDIDVLALSEVTVTLADALHAGGLERLLPTRVGIPVAGPEASVLWTRCDVIARGDPGPGPTWDAEASVEIDGRAVRIIATHPLPPVGADMRPHWQPGLASTAKRARSSGPPTLVVGDLNAARWHPAWRRFVDQEFVSAHEALGRGWTCSWPADRWWPPIVRLDHALCGPGMTPLMIRDLVIPGSDHRGFVVSIAANARTARPR
jgi:endonuclease/exonuclease/phosphatase (EEP) superfamily protein YafD